MKTIVWSDLSERDRAAVLARPEKRSDPALAETVARIISDIESNGVEALRRWSLQLDGRAPERFELNPVTIDSARAALQAEDLAALELAAENIRRYHAATRPADQCVEFDFGLQCRRLYRAIPACGLYAPGGSAPLFSTLLMLALPAAAAGVRTRIAVTPPTRDGAANPVMIAAAGLCGLDALWLVGGAQAIAALALGVFVPKADKIFGPGNAYVAEAKRQVSARGLAAVDLPAGPSELMVIADETADPAIVASDLLGQAEHDADAQVILVAATVQTAARVEEALAEQLGRLPRRKIAAASLEQSKTIIVRNLDEATLIANTYAPEHLALHVCGADAFAEQIENAGAIFLGAFSAEAFGDYICGPSHVLPTDGAARVYSGVTTASFMKSLSVQKLSPRGAKALAPATARLARLEGLEAHALSAEVRS